jgi:hypothetical protein
MRLSLLEECRSRAKQALGALGTEGTEYPREEMKLHAALGTSTAETPEMRMAFTKVLEIAESLGDTDYQLRALRGLFYVHTYTGRYRAGLQSAQKLYDLATTVADPTDRLFAERMMGTAKHLVGDTAGARRHLEDTLTHYAVADYAPDIISGRDVIRFGIDLRVWARLFLARVLWLQGFPDQAMRTAEMSLAEAQATGHVRSVCYALALAACPISFWVGDLSAAARYTELLLDHAKEHSSPLLHAYGSRYHAVLDLKRGQLESSSRQPRGRLDELSEPNPNFRILLGVTELAGALAQVGRIADGLAKLEAASEQFEPSWLTPELLRLKGELLLMQSSTVGMETVEHLFQQAQDEARRQEALSWELRAATSLARLLYDRGRSADAIASLQPVYDRFTEGFGTADLV